MAKWFSCVGIVAAVLLIPAACSLDASPGSVTVSGTLSGDYVDFIGNPVITVSKGGSSFPVAVTTVIAGNNVSGPYSIANVPPGDYSVSIEFSSSMYTLYAIPTYSIDGGTPVNIGTSPPVGGGTGPYSYLITVPSITINKESTIDIYLGDNG